MAQQTDPLASGLSSSEGKMTLGVVVVGVLIAILGAVAPILHDAAAQNPNTPWLALATMLCGALLAAAPLWKFTQARSLLKSNVLYGMLEQAGETVAPVIAQVLVQKYLAAQKGTVLPAKTGAELDAEQKAAQLARAALPTPAAGVPVVKIPPRP